MSEALNLHLSKFNYILKVSVFYINIKAKLVKIFVTLQKGFIKNVSIIALQIITIE